MSVASASAAFTPCEDFASTMIWLRPFVTPVIRSCVVVSGAMAMSSWSWMPFVPFGVSTPTTVNPMPFSFTVCPSGSCEPKRFVTTVCPRTTTRACCASSWAVMNVPASTGDLRASSYDDVVPTNWPGE